MVRKYNSDDVNLELNTKECGLGNVKGNTITCKSSHGIPIVCKFNTFPY